MYNRQLNTFLTVAKLGSFSKAAEALYITPSAVIQQINNLERDLQVSLLTRTKQGTTLTPAGEYLLQEGQNLIRYNEEIRRRLTALSEKNKPQICVGTTLLMKCRVFYELWEQFTKEHTDYEVRIINVEIRTDDLTQADILEGILDGEAWQKNRGFLNLCQTPIACAVPKGHELASRNRLTFEDMKGQTLVTIREGMSETLDQLRMEALGKGVHVTEAERYTMALFSMCIVNGYLLQTPLCWKDIHPDLVTIPCDWGYFLPYGFHYKKNPSKAVTEFLDFVRDVDWVKTF